MPGGSAGAFGGVRIGFFAYQVGNKLFFLLIFLKNIIIITVLHALE
jgi:hypothetical protein